MVKKVSVIGSGSVGSTLAFHLLSRLNLRELVLVDINKGLACGMALDLEDTRGFLKFSTKIKGTNNLSQIKDSDVIVITAGIPRKKGMTRADLLKINGKIASDIAKKIKKLSPNAIVIAVSNPLDIITHILTKELKFKRGRVMGMGSSLDTSRLYNILFKKSGVSAESIDACVFGAHSKDMIVSPDRFTIKGQNLKKFIKEVKDIVSGVQFRGAEIVSHLKTRSAYFAPSLACCCLIEAIANDSNEIIPVSVLLKGEYGLNEVCTGVPCLINRKGVDKIIEVELTASEKKEFKKIKDVFKG
ncbi:MAG: malate dehydrogenase [Candidatus Omnitrophica bacterium]|nr:malate dehydrogenase [Candidatus Omnitrophota bacterium]